MNLRLVVLSLLTALFVGHAGAMSMQPGFPKIMLPPIPPAPLKMVIDGKLDEFKTHRRGGQVVRRSKTPQLVEQEFYGMMLAHRAVRTLMNEAAQHLDPNRLSFTHSLRVIRRKLASPPALDSWLIALRDEILHLRLPPRKGRYGPRGVKRKMSGYPIHRSRGPTQRRVPHPVHRKIC